ncbi:hypothetical protein LWI28_017299 [Acer negundo]|uniref:Uncharacterized protein n=1 Tax=Acer negundo TaxID=4023 RepID=A0AAD5JJR3_ACENE|nr:hypothetical protein LWI28_017299 [Acer negundo]
MATVDWKNRRLAGAGWALSTVDKDESSVKGIRGRSQKASRSFVKVVQGFENGSHEVGDFLHATQFFKSGSTVLLITPPLDSRHVAGRASSDWGHESHLLGHAANAGRLPLITPQMPQVDDLPSRHKHCQLIASCHAVGRLPLVTPPVVSLSWSIVFEFKF